MFLASNPVGGAPMAGEPHYPFSGEAPNAGVTSQGGEAALTGRTVTGLTAARQLAASRHKVPVAVRPSGAMPAAPSSDQSQKVLP